MTKECRKIFLGEDGDSTAVSPECCEESKKAGAVTLWMTSDFSPEFLWVSEEQKIQAHSCQFCGAQYDTSDAVRIGIDKTFKEKADITIVRKTSSTV